MEQNNNVEQSTLDVQTSPVVENTRVESAVEGDTSCVDSTFGKFKDAKALREAYDNLQSEFTRKCQRLSELERKDNTREDLVPEYGTEHWREQLSTFLDNNPEAKNYASQIGQILIEDKVLASSPHSLDLAWYQVMKNNYVDPSSVGQQTDFFDKYIKDNGEIKDRIIKEYLDQVQHHTVPPLMRGGSSGGSNIEAPKTPTTLDEAKEVVARMFK